MPRELELPDLIEHNITEIARQTGQNIIDRQLPGYTELGLERLTQIYVIALNAVVRYLRTNDVAGWREYLVSTLEARQKSGIPPETMTNSINILVATTVQAVEKKLPGPENAELRAKHINRIKSLGGLANASNAGTYYKKKD